ncbi:acyl-ACP desaturase [Streptomyces sp. NPDC088197]|uniref:acyl-ACP desaturase n=1 Tax=Streptomyces sp. NPDC088197 TaxID=3365840 RepID=UPI003812DCD2
MRKDQENQLQEVFDAYALTWGPVQWRSRVAAVRRTGNDTFASMLYALAAVETDSALMRRKVHAIRGDRANALAQFNILWLAEEAEHGYALRAAASALGTPRKPSAVRRNTRHIRALVTWPTLYAAGLLMPHIQAMYCVLGAMQEYIALTTYRRIGELVGDPALDDLLKAIARQESHHMKFYRNCALILLEEPGARRTARLTMPTLWRPPGIDLLGLGQWLDVFGPLLRDPVYADRLARADAVLGDLIEDHSVTPMTSFLAKAGPRLHAAADTAPAPAWSTAVRLPLVGAADRSVGGRRR